MGMAASQARLLSLTGRLMDIELKAQRLQSHKLALATQKDELYERYCDALDATTINVAFWNDNGTTRLVQANFSSVCTYNEQRCRQYALMDNKTGFAIVDEKTKTNYEEYGNDKYTFAWAMMGLEGFNYEGQFGIGNPRESGMVIGYNNPRVQADYSEFPYADNNTLHMTGAEAVAYEAAVAAGDTELEEKYNKINEGTTTAEKQKALDEFRNFLYSKYSNEIFTEMNWDKQTTEDDKTALTDMTWENIRNEFNYYVQLWSMINNCGGCTTIDSEFQSGEKGDNWFNNMIEAGQVSIYEFNTNKKEWSETSPATSTNSNYLQEVQDDTDLKKAEAEYEHELDLINRKDTKFDTELSKLETERKAITTEMEAITKVRDENIDRTFKLFS